MCSENCNCEKCVWQRIIANQGEEILTTRELRLSYKVQNDTVFWLPLEVTLKTPYRQSKAEILKCIDNRKKKDKQGKYPGTATSYKWALLNSPKIWM